MDNSYQNELLHINIELLEPYKGAKQRHLMRCTTCLHEWEATPISKVRSHQKHGAGGCPKCTIERNTFKSRAANIATLLDRGLEILTPWTGQRVSDKDNTPVRVTVKNTKCGHVFTSTAQNLLSRNITCKICGIKERTANINKWSKANSAEWQKTADIWKQYKAEVMKHTRKSYKAHQTTINPNNVKFGKAGIEGAYQLDHIVPIRYCFENYVPPEVCGHQSNLQVLPWLENLANKDNLKEGVIIPELLKPYVVVSSQ